MTAPQRRRCPGLAAGLLILLTACTTVDTPMPDSLHFADLTGLAGFDRHAADGLTVLTSPWCAPPLAWNELVVSWNLPCPPGGHLQVEAQAADAAGAATPFYSLGLWSPDPARHPRESVAHQRDTMAEVKTDTLVCSRPLARARLRLTLGGGADPATVTFLGISFADSATPPPALPPERDAWGRTLDVPPRSQLGHPGGGGWCSPTSVSMVLAYWSRQLGRPELDRPVPEVAAGVHDRVWGGTGNWTFNTAFAGSFPGLRAYVTRLADVAEVEAWLAAGFPLVASLSLDLLDGRPRDAGSGHLVVVVGFTATGDVVLNDPFPAPKARNTVRRTVARADFARAWAHSGRTVYVVHPTSVTPPPNTRRHWAD